MKNHGAWSKEVFARNLKYYMERAGMNQKEMAKIVGVSAPAFCEWLNAKKYPRIDKIEILANYFGVLKSDLIEEKKEAVDSNGFGESKRLLLDFVMNCTEEQAERTLKMMLMVESILGNK